MRYLLSVVAIATLLGFNSVVASEDYPGMAPSAQPTSVNTFCFQTAGGDVKLKLNWDGEFITGEAKKPDCGIGDVLGDVAGMNLVFYRDWGSNSSCVEGVWYTARLLSWTYSWINTAGNSGTGSMTQISCASY